MSTNLKHLMSCLALMAGSIAAVAQSDAHTITWDNGFKVTDADKQFSLKFGGRIMWDNAFFFQDDSIDAQFGTLDNGSEFRRARFFMSGTVYSKTAFKLQLDFAGGKVSFKDAYMAFKGLPAKGWIRVGHFKEPFRLEALTSSKYITFMERGLPIAMLPERNTGFMLSNEFLSGRLAWQGGLFRRSDGAGDDKMADDGFALTARVTGLPIQNEEGTQLVHLGAAFTHRKPESRSFKIDSRPEAHLGNKLVNTGTIGGVSEIQAFNFEAAMVYKSASIQGEYTQSNVSSGGQQHTFSSYYAEISYFLTGEHRNYKNSYAGFDRVKPKNSVGNGEDGMGAWQIALRYSGMNLNSGIIAGGELNNITAGFNWHLNPVSRIMINYVHAKLKGIGNTSIVQMRAQIDF